MKHISSVLCLASFVLSFSASAAFTRLATETYPGGGGVATNAVAGITTNGVPVALDAQKIAHLIIPEGGGPTGGVTKAYVDAHDLATLFASTNYTDDATNALDLAHLAALAATNTALRSALADAALAATNYTDASTFAATNFVKAGYLPLTGGTMTGDITMGSNELIFDSLRSISTGPEDSLNFDANYYGFGGPAPVDRSCLTADGTDVVTSNMLNGVLAPATNALDTALRAAIDNEEDERKTADSKLLTKESPSYPATRNIKWSGYNLVLYGPMLFETWSKIKAGTASSNEELPDYLKDGAWNTAADPFAKKSDVDASTFAATNWVAGNYLSLTGGTVKGETKFTTDIIGANGSVGIGASQIYWNEFDGFRFTTPEIAVDNDFYFGVFGHPEKTSKLTPDETPVLTAKKAETDYPAITNSYPFALGNMVSNTVSQWEGYWNGSNVYWSVTNYLEAGNAKVMKLYEIQTNGVHREIWNDSDKYDIFFTNTLDAVASTNTFTREWVGTFVTNSLDAKADRAWGKYTSAGYDVPDTNMVWHTAPTTVFAGGFEFQKVAVAGGEIGVLVSQGAVPYAAGAEGKFIIGDGFGTNYFGYVKKDDYIIATRVDGIEVDQTTKMVTLTYDLVFSGEYPIVYYSPTVIPVTAQTWIQLNKSDGTLTPGAPWPVTFSTGAGYIKAHISFASATAEMPPEGFFTSSTAVIGGGTFKTNMKADFLDAGIMCTNTDTKVMGVIRPTFDGTTVHWNWSKQ